LFLFLYIIIASIDIDIIDAFTINVTFRIRYLISFFFHVGNECFRLLIYFAICDFLYYFVRVFSSVRFMLGLSLCCYPTGFFDG
jgi:hypothetical protein